MDAMEVDGESVGGKGEGTIKTADAAQQARKRDRARSATGTTCFRRNSNAISKLQLFDLVAGGAFERALEGMGRQEGGEVGSVDSAWSSC